MHILSGTFKGRALPVPVGARPAGARLRTRLFSVLGTAVEGARVLDVCAGAGGFGLEALSRGAADVTLLERDPDAARALTEWIARAGAGEVARVLRLDAVRAPWPTGPFDLVLLDPPFPAWLAGDGPALLAKARAVAPRAGLLAVKIPARQALPEAPGWKVLDRRGGGEAEFAILAAVGASGGAFPSSPPPGAPIGKGGGTRPSDPRPT
jgi:16S rRNA (guanine966-N2)-methyltransferase